MIFFNPSLAHNHRIEKSIWPGASEIINPISLGGPLREHSPRLNGLNTLRTQGARESKNKGSLARRIHQIWEMASTDQVWGFGPQGTRSDHLGPCSLDVTDPLAVALSMLFSIPT